MSFIKKVKKGLKNPKKIFEFLLMKFGASIDDELYLKILFYLRNGYKLDFNNPRTYNEKLQWLKLYDEKAKKSSYLVDKYLVKDYVAKKIGEEHIIPTLGVWDNVNDIDFNNLPNQFVLKCTHDSGGLVICTDKSELDIEKSKNILKKSLKRSFYHFFREYVYKGVKPRIIAEKYMIDEVDKELRDYKIFCFNGKPKIFMIASGRQEGKNTTTFFDENFNKLNFTIGYSNAEYDYEKPKNFDKMMNLALQLSEGFMHVRVDFYSVDGQVYFGEMTFYHQAGLVPIKPIEWDYKMGEMLKLPVNKKE
ncbi:glycosyl transferase [Candidatus Gracilibacteria bacterium]|nr:MAG: glycosyl transferase [Candidatus Gracilibacteria bacterium]